MKSFTDTFLPNKKPDKNKYRRSPQEIKDSVNPYIGICRVFPRFIADNFEYFEVIPSPKFPPKDLNKYVLQIKKKIACMKAEFSV